MIQSSDKCLYNNFAGTQRQLSVVVNCCQLSDLSFRFTLTIVSHIKPASKSPRQHSDSLNINDKSTLFINSFHVTIKILMIIGADKKCQLQGGCK